MLSWWTSRGTWMRNVSAIFGAKIAGSGKRVVIIGTVRYPYSSTEQASNCGRASVVGAAGIFRFATQKKTWEIILDAARGGGPVEKVLWQTIHRLIRNTKRQGRFVSTSRNLKQRLLDRVGHPKCCRDTMRTSFYRLRGLPSWEVVAVDADYWYSMRPQFLAFNLPNIT